MIQSDPQIIRLKLDAKQYENSHDTVNPHELKIEKQKRCAVCGQSGYYLKYHVVPILYRQAFPKSYKSHRSQNLLQYYDSWPKNAR